MANIPAWHHRAGARQAAPAGASSLSGLLDAVLNNSTGPGALLDQVIGRTEQQQAARAVQDNWSRARSAGRMSRQAQQLSRLARLHPGRMLLDELIEQGLSELARLLQDHWAREDGHAMIGAPTAGTGWVYRTPTCLPQLPSSHGSPHDNVWYKQLNCYGTVPNPAIIIDPAGEAVVDSYFAMTAYSVTRTEPSPVGFRYSSEHWEWFGTTPGAQPQLPPQAGPVLVGPDEVDEQHRVEQALRALPGPRDPKGLLNAPWPTSPVAMDGEEQVQPGVRVQYLRDPVLDLVALPKPGAFGPPKIIDVPTTQVVARPERQPMVVALPKPVRMRNRHLRERNLMGRRKLRMRWPVAAWAVRAVAESVIERCDQVKAVWNSLDPGVRKAIRQRWFEREWAAGNRRPEKLPPCSDMAKLLYEYRRFLRPEPVLRELLWEGIEDTLYGVSGKYMSDALGNIMGRQGPHTTINQGQTERSDINHWAAPMLPTETLQDWVTGRSQRTSTESERQFAIDEGIRRRREWAAARSRREY